MPLAFFSEFFNRVEVGVELLVHHFEKACTHNAENSGKDGEPCYKGEHHGESPQNRDGTQISVAYSSNGDHREINGVEHISEFVRLSIVFGFKDNDGTEQTDDKHGKTERLQSRQGTIEPQSDELE